MAEMKEPKAWITVNGNHVPIFDEDWIPKDIRDRYSRFINDKSMDKHLDSDELTWVEQMRWEDEQKKNKQIQNNEEEAKKLNKKEQQNDAKPKPWSKAEERRTQEASKMVDAHLWAGEDHEWMEYYDHGDYEEVYSVEVGPEYGYREGKEATVHKQNFVYKMSWDENDRPVKKGKRVPGTTYYTAAIDGEIIDDNVAGYKTAADARHALEIQLQWEKEREAKRRQKNGSNI